MVRFSNPKFNLKSKILFISVFGAIGLVGLAFTFAAEKPVGPNVARLSDTQEQQLYETTDQLIKLAREHRKNSSDTNIAYQLNSVAQQRHAQLEKLAANQPSAINRLALSDENRSLLPSDIAATQELPITVEGKVSSMMIDKADPSAKKFVVDRQSDYLTTQDGKKYNLKLTQPANISNKVSSTGINLSQINQSQINADAPSGSTITVTGLHIGDTVVATSSAVKMISAKSSSAMKKTASVVRQHKVAVLLVNFSDNKTQDATPDQVRQQVFTGSQSINTYFQEQSFGSLSLTGNQRTDGDVFGWYTIPDSQTTCDQANYGFDAEAAARSAGVDLSVYDHVMYVFTFLPSCSWSGIGEIQGRRTWINGGTNVDWEGAHEIGHNLGAQHANSYDCLDASNKRVSISNNCTTNEYGDPFEAMGGQPFGHASMYHKVQMGLADQSKIITTTGGTYTIYPLEQASSGPQGLRVLYGYDSMLGANQYYYIDFRKTFGFDRAAAGAPVNNGATIRIADDYLAPGHTQLIDTTPNTSDFHDAPLLAGQTFTDSNRNINITVNSVTPGSSMTVTVTTGNQICTHANPSVGLAPSSGWNDAGKTLSYYVTVTNNDSASCSNSTFNLIAGGPSNLTTKLNTSSLTIAPGSTALAGIAVTSQSTSAPGSYGFLVGASANGTSGGVGGYYNVNSPATAPTISSISPTSGPSAGGTTVTITGTNFDVGTTKNPNTNPTILFGNNKALNVHVLSGSQITATTPPGAGTVNISIITTRNQTTTKTAAFQYGP